MAVTLIVKNSLKYFNKTIDKLLRFSYHYLRGQKTGSSEEIKMKTTLKYFTIMATLALFSTLSHDVMAQKSTTASMTIEAKVVESTSLHALQDMRFGTLTATADGFTAQAEQATEFSISGSANLEVNISFKAPDVLMNEDGSSLYFTPVITVGQTRLASKGMISGQFKLDQMNQYGQGQTSIWIEGMIQSDKEVAQAKYKGDYLVSIDYN